MILKRHNRVQCRKLTQFNDVILIIRRTTTLKHNKGQKSLILVIMSLIKTVIEYYEYTFLIRTHKRVFTVIPRYQTVIN